jgi:predicted transcriptional regulator
MKYFDKNTIRYITGIDGKTKIVSSVMDNIEAIVNKNSHMTYDEIAKEMDTTEYDIRRALGLIQ